MTLPELLDKYRHLGEGKTLEEKIELNQRFREEFRELPAEVQEAYTEATRLRIEQMRKEEDTLIHRAEALLARFKKD